MKLAAPQPIEHYYTLSIPIPEVILHPGWKAPGERGYIGNPAQVLKLKTEGKNFIEIATELGIPYSTAKMWYYEGTEETPKPSPRYVYDPKEIIRLRAAGKTFEEIGDELKVGTRTVYRRYRVALDAGEVPPEAPAQVRHLSGETIAAIVSLKSQGKAIAEIVRTLGVSRSTVMYHLSRPSIERATCDPETVLQLRREGYSVFVVASKLGISQWRVKKVVKDAIRAGADPELIIPVPRKLKIEDPSIVVPLREAGKTFAQIAEALNVAVATVSAAYYKATGLKRSPRRKMNAPAAAALKTSSVPRRTCAPEDVVRLRAEGKSFKEIAQELKFSEKTVYLAFGAAKKAGIVNSSVIGPTPVLESGTVDAITHLNAAGKTVDEIAAELEVSRKKVLYHLNKPPKFQREKDFDAQLVLDLRSQGKTVAHISQVLKISTWRVSKVIQLAVTSGADPRLLQIARTRKIADPACVLRLRSAGKKFSEIADALNVSPATARDTYYRAAGETPIRKPRAIRRDPAEVVQLKADGKSFAEIGEQLNISQAVASRLYYRTTGEKPVPHPTYIAHQEEILRLKAAGKSVKEIAEKLNLPHQAVYRQLRSHRDKRTP